MLAKDNAGAALPEIVSAPEAAEILMVSPQRVHGFAAGLGSPKPVYEFTVGKLWLREAIVEYGNTRNRKPGRPRPGNAHEAARDQRPARRGNHGGRD